MPAWRLDNDVLSLAGLRLRLHRIGLTHWRAGTTLRSWGAVPLHADGDALHVPCGAGEALWLGAWLDDEPASAMLRLGNAGSGRTAVIALPGAFQIASVPDAGGADQPIIAAQAPLLLELASNGSRAGITLLLQDPAAWSTLSGRDAPAPLGGPPPLPPRLG
jgi:hypothetical protein